MSEQEILEQLKQINILMRVNNALLSKFIVKMQTVSKVLHLPPLVSFMSFELLEDDYKELLKDFKREDIDKALFWLDRQMVRNKMQCPHNIKRYIRNKLIKKGEKKFKDAEEKEQNN